MSTDLVTLINGTEPKLTVAVHGAAVLFGAHTPLFDGFVLAVLLTVAGGLALAVAVTV